MNVIQITHWSLDYLMWGVSFKSLLCLINSVGDEVNPVDVSKLAEFGIEDLRGMK
jgi:hypothetical protein